MNQPLDSIVSPSGANGSARASLYTPAQRRFALAYGLIEQALFALAVVVMAVSFYNGLAWGHGPLRGHAAFAANLVLLAQFPLGHSLLLSDRGRRWMAERLPLNLGRPLATTTFAAVASIQLLVCFLAWSPSGIMLWTPPHAVHHGLTVLFAVSWLLLVRAMREAGTSLQTGSLGWRAVVSNRAPAYPPLATQGMHRVIRQPIYASFALILWTSPSFSADRVALAVLWTLYCVAGARLKEKRLARFHGAAFAEYQRRVPFWIPLRRRSAPASDAAPTAQEAPPVDVVIIGGGPVGLTLAALLAKSRRSVLLFEANPDRPRRSMAMGITPPSLETFSELGLMEAFLAKGLRIQDAFVHERRTDAGHLNLRDSQDAFPFILSLPQAETVEILRSHVASQPNVKLHFGWRVTGLRQDAQGVTVTAQGGNEPASAIFRARLAAACDGSRGEVCTWLGIASDVHAYGPEFTMADFTDRSGLGDQAHLFFGPERPVESFPLPGGRRRWIVRTGRHGQEDLHQPLEEAIGRLTGLHLQPSDRLDSSRFQPQWKLARRFHRGRVALCGDAAHVMSPIGGQGMNTGLGDAAFLARAFAAVLDGRGTAERWLKQYHRRRRLAFRTAARRAAWGMALGTASGPLASKVRKRAIRLMLEGSATRRWILRWLTMRSVPPVQQQVVRAARGLGEESSPA